MAPPGHQQRVRYVASPAGTPGAILDPRKTPSTDGAVRHATSNDLPVASSVDEANRFILAYQFVEQHGEVRPANWNPGADTMRPDPVGSQEYFSKQK